MKPNFDFIAPFYDQLAKLVFGRSIVDSQLYFLNLIPDNASVLILGGGTGWLLEALIARKPACSIYYIEASSRMLRLTHQRKLNERTILICGTEDDIPSGLSFDVAITNFYLDLFSEERLDVVISKIAQHTTSTTLWIVTDFIKEQKWWQRIMLKVMYFFFKNISGIEASTLPEWKEKMLQHGWAEQESKQWYQDFIKSVIFRRRRVI